MVNEIELGSEFFAVLERADEAIARQVAAGGCDACEGPLHRGDYARKPRGALIAPAGEAAVIRFSLCCGREGCRKRATPPSLRFLGRRVYLGAVVILASLHARLLASATAIRHVTGVPVQTVRRWLGWWCGPFVATDVFATIRARLIGVTVEDLPASILQRLAGTAAENVRALLTLLAPLTTGSVRDGARCLRGAP